jgi:hypothetical protein
MLRPWIWDAMWARLNVNFSWPAPMPCLRGNAKPPIGAQSLA